MAAADNQSVAKMEENIKAEEIEAKKARRKARVEASKAAVAAKSKSSDDFEEACLGEKKADCLSCEKFLSCGSAKKKAAGDKKEK